jgi:IclR family mhp operon transcriptional activator
MKRILDEGEAKRPYDQVRALARGIALIKELNRVGQARPSALASATALDRTTTYRLLATLEELGLVTQSPSTDEYVLTSAVKTLSEGFTERDRLLRIVAPQLGLLFQQVLWPTDFAVFERGHMVTRETTHRFSPYSVHRAVVGQPRSLLNSALGRAALAGASKAERANMLRIAAGAGVLDNARSSVESVVNLLLKDFATRGYAASIGYTDPRISAIALPVCSGGSMVGAINLVFFRSAMSVEVAAERYLAELKQCVASIESQLERER